MKLLKTPIIISLTFLLLTLFSVSAQNLKVLVFTKVEAGSFRHAEAESEAINEIQRIGENKLWTIDLTTNSNSFTIANLSNYDAVVFNNNLGNILTAAEENAFVSYINNGGGYVGLHAAGATETSWEWYQELVGTTFDNHPAGLPSATMNVETNAHISTSHLTQTWSLEEEWYNWNSNPREKDGVQVLLTVDESTYSGGTMGSDHPISWCREYDGGRMFYTALGHDPDHFSTTELSNHIAGGIEWVSKDKVVQNNLLLDLDANSGVTLENSNLVGAWKNKISSSAAQNFVKNDIGRDVPGSGRPTLKEGVNALSGRNTLIFNEDELINFNEDAFDHLITGSGYTWLAVLLPYVQQADNTDNLANVSAFFGNLRNGQGYEGIWGAFEDDNKVWMGSRNGNGGGRNTPNNPHAIGPELEAGKYYIIAGRQLAGTGTVDIELFVDNANVIVTRAFPVNVSANSSKFAIGTERDATNHPGRESFDGELARFLLYDRPLSNAELQQTINALDGTYDLSATPIITNTDCYDFETGDLQGATITSGAFSEIVTDLEYFNHPDLSHLPYNKGGDYFLSTLETINGPKSDSYVGKITSPLFVLEEPQFSLLVGGGSSSDLYFGIYLQNGTEIYKTNGSNSEPLEMRIGDLSQYLGETVYWQIADLSMSGWGYIAVDDIKFNQNSLTNNQDIDEKEFDLSIYPNPITSKTTILNAQNATINIYDVKGSIVFTKFITSENELLDLNSLGVGVYFAKVNNESSIRVIKLMKI